MYTFVDIFCGAGGLSYGFSQDSSFKLLMANDIDKDAIATYKTNHKNSKVICRAISDITNNEIKELGGIDIVIGGPPCQSYSTLGKRQMDSRALLFQEYLRFLKIAKPKVFVFENVVGLLSMQKGELFKNICREFEQLGYKIKYKILNAVDFGVPQNRERVFIFGSQINNQKDFCFPENKENPVSIAEALSDLPAIQSGENGDKIGYLFEANNKFLKFVRKSNRLTEHKSPMNNKKLIEIMQNLKDGQCKDDLPENIRPKSGYTNTYAKMWWNLPAPTITRNFSTPSSSRCIHPRDSRALSIREGARLQSFPDNYVFCGSNTAKRLQIGNAVPPLVSIALAKSIKEFLD